MKDCKQINFVAKTQLHKLPGKVRLVCCTLLRYFTARHFKFEIVRCRLMK